MLVRAGGGAFEKLSIPRDTFAAIPGAASQKINAAYAFGGAALQIETVEDFLGIDIDHVVILDFEGFADFIDVDRRRHGRRSTRRSSRRSMAAPRTAASRSKLRQGENDARRPGGAGAGADARRTSATRPRTTSTAPGASS